MVMLCDKVELEGKGVKCWAFNPGYVVTDLSGTGKEGREERRRNGAGDARVSAKGILDICEGRRDGEVGGFLGVEGGHGW